MMNFIIKNTDNKSIYFLMFLAILACYNSVFLTQYGFSDDWAWFYSSQHNPFELLKWDILTGRPSYGIIRWLCSFMVGSVASLGIFRLISVLTLFLLCVFIYRFISKKGLFSGVVQRAVFSLLICMLPSFQVYAGWTICFPFVASVLLAGLSYNILSEHVTLAKTLISLLLLTLAFSIYQPTAMCFVFFAFLDLVIAKDKIKPARLLIPAVVLFFGMAAALFLAKIFPLILFGEATTRTTLSWDIVEKIKWFIREPLVNAICNFDLGKKALYLTLSSLIVLYGTYSLSRTQNKNNLIIYIVLFALAASAPGLLVKESWAAYRTVPAITMIFTTLFLAGIFTFFEKYKFTDKAWLSLTVLVVMMANNNLQSGFSTPQQIEYQVLKKEILRSVPQDYTGMLYYKKPDNQSRPYADSQKYDEFGAFSLGMDWTFRGMALSIKHEKKMQYSIAANPMVSENNQCNENCRIIDISDRK